jgi:Leucine-rich repeat (LRR) protein
MAETKITPLYIKTISQKFDFMTVFFLDLSKRNIFSVGVLGELENLLTLDLSNNNLQGISGLEKCKNLKMLRLSHNKISNTVALSSGSSGGCVNLQRLELQGNKIQGTENLPDSLPNLEVIYLQEFDLSSPNPVCKKFSYEKDVYKRLPKLRCLDGNRKAVKMEVKMDETIPEMDLDDYEYDPYHEEWFN